MTRTQRQSLKRTRDKIGQLERMVDKLVYELHRARGEWLDAWHRIDRAEAQNRGLMELIATARAMEPPSIMVTREVVDMLKTTHEKNGVDEPTAVKP